MITQLTPTIPMDTPKGPAKAHFVIDYGQEHHLLWVCFQDDTGECWTWPNYKVKLQANISMGQRIDHEHPLSGLRDTLSV
ncbi:hypothetical protein UFOVP838_41 [uncultured Caudovirales phage]|uniref:Uncharacterized protein n=1 Tax=uncultured Caudovirales phage TaxID=2100421 RepID=A0A6J5P407_9CAUD|nr:hypothetical protein UFOVP838_41 [uncultured Caudovirales phage]CAB4171754.1 hypothetical protein UFOVP932_26 [uncultured Caudovirales phage]CAB4177587.1 hypothetical protein UFOVP1010_14 [uncultured Caudovirales phage]CAB4201874.1 hypothetical protein UFOVP1359_2 [uncultured Caudovirales phage]